MRYRVRATNRMRRELHLASSPVTRARTRAAYSSGVANHCSDPAFATNPRPDASSRFDRTLTSACASPSASSEGKAGRSRRERRDPRSPRPARPRPPGPGRTPRRRRGPCPRASRGARGTWRRRARRRSPPARGRDSQVTFGPRSTSVRARSSRAPAPISRSDASGYLLRDARPRVHEQVDALVELERADEQRNRALGQRSGRNEERVQVHERRERGRRLDPELANHPGREVRDRPHLVDVPHRPGRDAVGERVEEATRLRAVEPRRGAPVAVHVEDHLRAAAREAPRDHRRGGVVRALDEHRVRVELAQQLADPERKRRVEEERRRGAAGGAAARA